MVGPDAYIKGKHMEIAIRGLGGYEGVDTTISPPPFGMHMRSDSTSTLTGSMFGIVGNAQKDGWLSYDGDFFTPGDPENGWGIQIGTTGGSTSLASNNCSFTQEINGVITNCTKVGSYFSVDWEGDCTTGTDLHFKINYLMQDSALFYATSVSITNNTAAAISNLYYYKNMDPDNNEPIFGSFTTTNKIVSQPTPGNNIAHVSATQTGLWDSYIGLIGVGDNWRADYGGFSNRGAANLWYGIGFTQTVGAVNTSDEAISLAYRIQNLNPGETETFYFNTVIDTASIDAAKNGLLFLDFVGEDNNSSVIPDTIKICGPDSVQINVSGVAANNFTWVWNPSIGLSDSIGLSVFAYPFLQTTYTVVGTPISGTTSPDTLLIVVETFPGFSLVANLSSLGMVCTSSPSFLLTGGSPLGGVYGGAGVVASSILNPYVLSPGIHIVSYTVSDSTGCATTDTATILVNQATANLPFVGLYCYQSAPFILSVGSPVGGVYSGAGVVSDTIFDASTLTTWPGIFSITYTYTDSLGCVGSDVNNIQIEDCVGIVANDLSNTVLLYPNPFTDFTTINISKAIQVEEADLFIYDILGKVAMKISTINEHEFKLERKNLESGVYFYKLENQNKIIASGKLIVY